MKIKILIGLLVFVLLVYAGISFAFNTGKQVDVSWTEEDLETALEKSKVNIGDIEEINVFNLIEGNFSAQGTNDIDEFFTSEEISALISAANDNNGPIKNVKISFNENGKGEVSFNLSDNFASFLKEQSHIIGSMPWEAKAAESNQNSSNPSLTDTIVSYITNKVDNKPVYATGELTRASDNSIYIKIDYLSVGRIPLPQETINTVEYETVRVINAIISPENGFYIEELQIRDNELYYKGTLPSEIEGKKL